MTTLIELARADCEQLLRAGIFGRVVLPDGPRGPEILPVNYTTLGDAILVCTAAGSLLDQYADGAALLFEVDQVDHERHHGWSVVARGTAERVPDAERADAMRGAPGPPRWLRRDEWSLIRLPWDELSGRQVGAGWDALSAMPVRRVWS